MPCSTYDLCKKDAEFSDQVDEFGSVLSGSMFKGIGLSNLECSKVLQIGAGRDEPKMCGHGIDAKPILEAKFLFDFFVMPPHRWGCSQRWFK